MRLEPVMTDDELAKRSSSPNDPAPSAYGASYLWLARRTRSELVTLDRQLEAAGATDL
jgi:predicted nucleic acid-binding protein